MKRWGGVPVANGVTSPHRVDNDDCAQLQVAKPLINVCAEAPETARFSTNQIGCEAGSCALGVFDTSHPQGSWADSLDLQIWRWRYHI